MMSENIVVVGGGASGTLMLRSLQGRLSKSKYNLVLVTATPFYTHIPACIRYLVKSGAPETVCIPYDKFINCQIVVGKVVEIQERLPNGRGNGSGSGGGGVLTLDTGEVVKFSVAILATGCSWEGPLDFSGKSAQGWRDRFAKAEDIIIVGGGATGLEFAGEIRDLSRNKRITIVHDQPLLLNEAYPDSFRKTVAKNIRRRDVGVITEDSIHNLEISDANTIRTDNGRLLVADLVIPCRGPRPNTQFLSALEGEITPLVESGHVKILPTFQLLGHPRIFAIGDIIAWDEQKQAEKYPAHVDVAVKNVLDVLAGKQPNALYHGCYETIVISNGKEGGSTYYSYWGPHLEFGNRFFASAKTKALQPQWPQRSMLHL